MGLEVRLDFFVSPGFSCFGDLPAGVDVRFEAPPGDSNSPRVAFSRYVAELAPAGPIDRRHLLFVRRDTAGELRADGGASNQQVLRFVWAVPFGPMRRAHGAHTRTCGKVRS
jgi:hypothetical protein